MTSRTTLARVGRIAGAFIACEVVLLASVFSWIALYSLVLNPGQPEAFYGEYIQHVSPIVSIVVGFPVFYAMGHVLSRHSAADAWITLVLFLGIDFAIVAVSTADPLYHGSFWLVSSMIKSLAVFLAIRRRR